MAAKVKAVWDYCRAAWAIWGPAMSGAFSVPFAAAAVFVEARYAQIIWGAMAYGALIFMGYLFFRRVRNLEERIKPKLLPSFDMGDFMCVRPGTEVYQTQTLIGGGGVMKTGVLPPHTLVPTMPPFFGQETWPKPEFFATWYRIKVECDGIESVTNCFGRLEQIKKNGVPIRNWEPTILPFAPAENNDAISKMIHKDSPAFLDFMFINDNNRAGVTPHGFVGSSSINWYGLFAEPSMYSMRIHILSDTPTIGVEIPFQWTGERSTSEITCRAVNI